MPVRVARGVKSHLREFRDGFILQVVDADDGQAARAGMQAARRVLCGLAAGPETAFGLGPGEANTPAFVGPVIPAGTGPALYVDAGGIPDRLLMAIPQLLADQLEQAGVGSARLVCPKGGGPLNDAFGRGEGVLQGAGLLALTRPPRRREDLRLPRRWLEVATTWVTEGVEADQQLYAQLSSLEFPLAVEGVRPLLEQWRETKIRSCRVVAGDLDARLRGVRTDVGVGTPQLGLAVGGPKASKQELLAGFDKLVEVARDLAVEAAQVAVTLDAYFWGQFGHDWEAQGGEQLSERVSDQLCLDAFPYQILGPGHAQRLGGLPAGAQPLEDGKWELFVGQPADWLVDLDAAPTRPPLPPKDPYRQTPQVVARGRQLLAGCLFEYGESVPLIKQRWRRDGWPPKPGQNPPAEQEQS